MLSVATQATCPHDHRDGTFWKNATQMPAMIARLTVINERLFTAAALGLQGRQGKAPPNVSAVSAHKRKRASWLLRTTGCWPRLKLAASAGTQFEEVMGLSLRR